MSSIATKFIGKKNPFTGEPKRRPVVTDGISITSDPLPRRKAYPKGKYDDLFASMQPGQSLRVPTPVVNTVSQGLRAWLRRRGDTVHVVRSATEYDGDPGHGRVWLMGGAK